MTPHSAALRQCHELRFPPEIVTDTRYRCDHRDDERTSTNTHALIEEGRKHDDAMADGVWYATDEGRVCRDDAGVSLTVCNVHRTPDTLGIAWLRANLRALLDG
jgi:hypothetical protein